MGWAAGRRKARAAPTVNNFAANRAATGSDWPLGFISGIGSHWFSRPGGPGLLTSSRFNDFELMDRPVGRGLTL